MILWEEIKRKHWKSKTNSYHHTIAVLCVMTSLFCFTTGISCYTHKTSSNVHLEINVTRGWHYDDVFPFFSEGQGTVPDLAAGHQEVVLRTQHILAQVVDPDKVGGNNRDFRLWTCNDMQIKWRSDIWPFKDRNIWKLDILKVRFGIQ